MGCDGSSVMSAEQRTLSRFTDGGVTSPEQTYTATDVHPHGGNGSLVGTARRDWVASMLRKYPEACDIYRTGVSPRRYEAHHYQRENQIEEHAEEHGTPGVPVDIDELAPRLDANGHYDCEVRIDERTDAGRQVIEVNAAVDVYEIHVNPHIVQWVE